MRPSSVTPSRRVILVFTAAKLPTRVVPPWPNSLQPRQLLLHFWFRPKNNAIFVLVSVHGVESGRGDGKESVMLCLRRRFCTRCFHLFMITVSITCRAYCGDIFKSFAVALYSAREKTAERSIFFRVPILEDKNAAIAVPFSLGTPRISNGSLWILFLTIVRISYSTSERNTPLIVKVCIGGLSEVIKF